MPIKPFTIDPALDEEEDYPHQDVDAHYTSNLISASPQTLETLIAALDVSEDDLLQYVVTLLRRAQTDTSQVVVLSVEFGDLIIRHHPQQTVFGNGDVDEDD